MRKELREYVVVKVRDIFKDKHEFDGKSKLQIFYDVTHNPQKFTNNCGIVVSTPVDLSREPIYWFATGNPRYAENPPYEFRSSEDIAMEIKEGSKVYFHYNTLLPNSHEGMFNHRYVGHEYEEDPITKEMINWLYFRVKYNQIFCMVEFQKTNKLHKDFDWSMEKRLIKTSLVPAGDHDDDQQAEPEERFEFEGNIYARTITPIGSWTLVEPDQEDWDDISIPIPEMEYGLPKIDLKTGKPIMKPKDQWILKKAMPGNQYLKGWVRHCGTPLKGDKKEIFNGVYCMYRPNTDTSIEIEGTTYHRMLQSNIVAIFPTKHTV